MDDLKFIFSYAKIQQQQYHWELDFITEYIKVIEESLEKNLEKYNAKLETQIQETNTDEYLEYKEHLQEIKGEINYTVGFEYPNLSRALILVKLYNGLEIALIKTCVHLGLRSKKEFKPKELKGTGDLEKLKNFLKYNFNIRIGSFHNYQLVQGIRILRNKVVHNESLINIKTEKQINSVLKLSEQIEGIDILKTVHDLEIRQIQFNSINCIYELSKICKNFYDLVIKEIEDTI